MIRLADIEKVYRTEKIETVALANVNMDVAPGEFVSIMGPSGCGKSTLLHVMGLLDAPTRGTVALDGTVVDSFDDRRLAPLRNKEIGFIFQTFHLIPDLSVVDNVEIPLLYRRMSNADRRKLALTALNRVGLASRVHHFPGQLSGGQQQRVAIARAIVADATFLLCDEPTGDLDRKSADEILELLEKLVDRHGKTILMVTHDPRAAERAHATLHLDKGVLSG